jgi:hypothetical protein
MADPRDPASRGPQAGGVPDHTATASALGYLYQSELALLELIKRAKGGPEGQEPDVEVAIELVDDVSFGDGTPEEILQTKHRISRQGSLTDASVDLWRTIKVWIDLVREASVQIGHTTFSLFTTDTASGGSAASNLRPGSQRDVESAQRRLEQVAVTSENQNNAGAYAAFNELDEALRRQLVGSIYVFDGAPTIAQIPDQIAEEVYWAAESRFLHPLIERLLGWWHRQVVKQLTRRSDLPLTAESVRLTIRDLREQFTSENLPIDVGIHDAEGVALSEQDRIFIEQLQLIALSNRQMEIAIRDYKRAFTQRSRWTRDQLLVTNELERYESALVDEWEHYFAAIEDVEYTSEEKRQAAGADLHDRMMAADNPIRPRVRERFIARGSLHMLANELRVGWHPEFVKRLRHLLAGAEPGH